MSEVQQFVSIATLMDVAYEESDTGDFIIRAVDLDDLFANTIDVQVKDGCLEYEPVEYSYWEPVENIYNETDFQCASCHRYKFSNGEMRRKLPRCPVCGVHMREGMNG